MYPVVSVSRLILSLRALAVEFRPAARTVCVYILSVSVSVHSIAIDVSPLNVARLSTFAAASSASPRSPPCGTALVISNLTLALPENVKITLLLVPETLKPSAVNWARRPLAIVADVSSNVTGSCVFSVPFAVIFHISFWCGVPLSTILTSVQLIASNAVDVFDVGCPVGVPLIVAVPRGSLPSTEIVTLKSPALVIRTSESPSPLGKTTAEPSISFCSQSSMSEKGVPEPT